MDTQKLWKIWTLSFPRLTKTPTNPTWHGGCNRWGMNLESVQPTWPEQQVADMRRKQDKQLFKTWRNSKHVRRICVACNSFQGSRMAWQFSNELLAIAKATPNTP